MMSSIIIKLIKMTKDLISMTNKELIRYEIISSLIEKKINGAAAARQHDLVGLDGLGQPPRDDVLGHQRRDLDPDIEHRPVEARVHAAEHGLEPGPRQMSGQEQDVFSHVRSLFSLPPF